MVGLMTSMEWYRRVVGDATVNAVAARAGVVQTTLNRQVKVGRLAPETAVAIARAYGVDVIDGLLACGLLTEEDVRRHGIVPVLEDATDDEIAEEVMRRLRDAHPGLDKPLR